MAAPVIEAPEIKLEGAEVTVTPELEAALDKAVSSAEIRQIILNEAAKQNITIPGDAKPRPAPEKKDEVKDTESELEDDEAIVYADDFVIGGKAYHFEGDSPADVNRQVKAAMAAHENAIHPEKKETPIAKKALTADEKVALQLDMQLGRITPEQYLEKQASWTVTLRARESRSMNLRKSSGKRSPRGKLTPGRPPPTLSWRRTVRITRAETRIPRSWGSKSPS